MSTLARRTIVLAATDFEEWIVYTGDDTFGDASGPVPFGPK